MSSKQKQSSFASRKSIKSPEQKSKRANTKRTREWERSKHGLEAALLKIHRNRRVAWHRKLTALGKDPIWATLDDTERRNRLKEEEQLIKSHYDLEESNARKEWETVKSPDRKRKRPDSEDSGEDIKDEDGSEAEEVDENEIEEGLDLNELPNDERAKIASAFERILASYVEDLERDVIEPFEACGSVNEEEAEYTSSEGASEDHSDDTDLDLDYE
jgi:hypothetical protein